MLFILALPAHAGMQRPPLHAPGNLDALETLSKFSEAGWVSCPLPQGYSALNIRMSDIRVRAVDGPAVAGLVEKASGVTVIKPRLDVAACEIDPDCIETQQAETALGLYRWSGATKGARGTCVFEEARPVDVPDVVVTLAPPPPVAPVKISHAEATLDRALKSELSPRTREIFEVWKGTEVENRERRAVRMKKLDELESEVEALLKQFQ